jgi:hypothetical protein
MLARGTQDLQCTPTYPAQFHDIYPWANKFLGIWDQNTLCCIHAAFQFCRTCAPLWFTHPLPTGHHGYWRFGTFLDVKWHTLLQDQPSPYSMLHYAWTYLSPSDGGATCWCMHVIWDLYSTMRRTACLQSISFLGLHPVFLKQNGHLPRPPPWLYLTPVRFSLLWSEIFADG